MYVFDEREMYKIAMMFFYNVQMFGDTTQSEAVMDGSGTTVHQMFTHDFVFLNIVPQNAICLLLYILHQCDISDYFQI